MTLSTRQKSCRACIQAKRRCDRRLPVCTRCEAKHQICAYASRHVTGSDHLRQPLLPAVTKRTYNDAFFISSEFGHENAYTFGNAILEEHGMCLGGGFDGLQFPTTLEDIVPDFGTQECPADNPQQVESSSSPEESKWSLVNICQNIKPWHMHDPNSTLYTILAHIKAIPTSVSARSACPFIHPALYREHMPKCIESCFSMCALYTGRNEKNMPMVMQCVHSGLGDIMDAQGNTTDFLPENEQLARTQSLLVYLIVGLFDGDIMLRAQAERGVALLLAWVGKLCSIRGSEGYDLEPGLFAAGEKSVPEWQLWMFGECLRRTIVMAHSVLGLYYVIADTNVERTRALESSHTWTLSRSLWSATCAHDFERAWKGNRRYHISSYGFEGFLESGQPEDVDELAELMLTAYISADRMRTFMASSSKGS